jgi:hypothetical protein
MMPLPLIELDWDSIFRFLPGMSSDDEPYIGIEGDGRGSGKKWRVQRAAGNDEKVDALFFR